LIFLVQGEERTRWERLAKTIANCLHKCQQMFDELLRRHWFAQQVLMSLLVSVGKGDQFILDNRWINPQCTEEIKLLIVYRLLNAADYDKQLHKSMLIIANVS